MPAMNRVRVLTSGNPSLNSFIKGVNEDIQKLNKLIDEYNASTVDNAVDKLKEILQYKQFIENKYSDKYIAECPDFSREIHQKLFAEIQTEFAKYGIVDLYGITEAKPLPPANHFANVLANISADNVNKLITILSKDYFTPNSLKNLLNSSDKGYKEYQDFINNNAISFLGGGNSKNFKIEPSDGSPPYVLKVENRMGMPKLALEHVKDKALKDTLIPVMVERQGTNQDNKGVRNIGITEFCTGGDLMSHSSKQATPEKRTTAAIGLYTQMVDVLIELGKDGVGFPDMKNTNWLSDADNRLLIADTKAFIFCEPGGTIDYQKTIASTNNSFVQSTFLNPPEFYSHLAVGVPISSEKMHSFMLGKNIYQYLTQCSDDVLYSTNSGEYFNFSSPIFNTEEGKQLASLIKNLVKYDPADRMSLQDARLQLSKIQTLNLASQIEQYPFRIEGMSSAEYADQVRQLIKPTKDPVIITTCNQEAKSAIQSLQKVQEVKSHTERLISIIQDAGFPVGILSNEEYVREKTEVLRTADDPQVIRDLRSELVEIIATEQPRFEALKVSEDLLNELKKFRVGANDTKMDEFILQKQQLLRSTQDPEAIKTISRELENTLAQQKMAAEVNDIVKCFRDNAGFFTIGMKDKANRIEQAMQAIPIEDRGKIHDKNYAPGQNLLMAIASHRIFSSFRSVKVVNNEIDEKTAAKSYVNFKNKYREATQDKADVEDKTDDNTMNLH